MKYRKFSDTGREVSEIGLGCWGLGGNWSDVSDRSAMDILNEAYENGVNFLDTADVYGNGRSEKIIGKFARNKKKLFIATKCGERLKPHLPERYNRQNFEKFIDRSLFNLRTECIDLMQLHCPPKQLCSKKEVHDMMRTFIKQGKIKYYGFSVFNLNEAYEALKFDKVKSIQLVFNLFRQRPSEEFFKIAKKKKVAIIARGSLASGLLSGTINQKSKFAPSDHRNYNKLGKSFDIGDTFSGINISKGYQAVEKLIKILPKNFNLIDLSLKWILMHKAVTVVIPGATNKFQVKMNTAVSEKKNILSLMKKINKIYEENIKKDVHRKW